MHVFKDSMWRGMWKILQNFLGCKQGHSAVLVMFSKSVIGNMAWINIFVETCTWASIWHILRNSGKPSDKIFLSFVFFVTLLSIYRFLLFLFKDWDECLKQSGSLCLVDDPCLVYVKIRPCLVRKNFWFRYCSTFVFIW